MTLADIQTLLDGVADTVLQTGAEPKDAEIEIYAQDGGFLRAEIRWQTDSAAYEVTVKRP